MQFRHKLFFLAFILVFGTRLGWMYLQGNGDSVRIPSMEDGFNHKNSHQFAVDDLFFHAEPISFLETVYQ